jgi:ankyrin repeat protein
MTRALLLAALAALAGCGGGDDAAAPAGRDLDRELIAAAYDNDVGRARQLIAAGADVNAKDETEQSAYLIATSEVGPDPALLDLTLRNGADTAALDSYDGTGLIRAAERGFPDIVRRLLATQIEVDHVNRLGWTALLEAIVLGEGGPAHTETVRLIVDAGADVDLADGDGTRPLAHAEERGFDAIARILRRAGAR